MREPLSVIQGALLGFMALVLAFGLTLGVGRYEGRRTAVVTEANAIGTTYLRAELLAEPPRAQAMRLLERYTDASVAISKAVPDSRGEALAVADSGRLQKQLWGTAEQAIGQGPVDSAPRLYVESLNEAFDSQNARVAGLGNRVPTSVLALELLGAAVALEVLATHLSILGRGMVTGTLAAFLVGLMLLVT